MNNNSCKEKLWSFDIYNIKKFGVNVDTLPFSIRVLFENVIRNSNNILEDENVSNIAFWKPEMSGDQKFIDYKPARVLMQDFTWVPALVDLAMLRDEFSERGGDPKLINPQVPVEMVIDHSVQIDFYGTQQARKQNTDLEFSRNEERYNFLKWWQWSFDNFTIVPPGKWIVHQVNIERLARVVMQNDKKNELYPDTVVGTDSHTTMVNGLWVIWYGVWWIEAEAVMLGKSCNIKVPEVVGVKLVNIPNERINTTDIVLYITQTLRKKWVVDKFVEFFGEWYKNMSVPERATIANMAPEYGATVWYCPIDEKTISYLNYTRGIDKAAIVEEYSKAVWLFYYGNESGSSDNESKKYSDVVEIDLSKLKPSVAGPDKPQDRVDVDNLKKSFEKTLEEWKKKTVNVRIGDNDLELSDGSVVLASITSCTNTSNPSVLIWAWLIAKKAAELWLTVPKFVKTSFAPGSQVVTEYLENMWLQKYLNDLSFNVVWYGCATCIWNSGPLNKSVEIAINENQLNVASATSGNRNFKGRIQPYIQSNYLTSPMRVIVYALFGRVDVDVENTPLGIGEDGKDIFLRDIWPKKSEIEALLKLTENKEIYDQAYSDLSKGDENWENIDIGDSSELYQWDEKSTYIRRPNFLDNMNEKIGDVVGARCLLLLWDSVTTDHISPAWKFFPENPAGKYLIDRKISESNFNSYGSRRWNHEVMEKGTFANIKIENKLIPEKKGWYTYHIPSEKEMSVYDAAVEYKKEDTPLVVIAGKEYGTGSSRDWAAKGTQLLGVKAVIAQSFERIHRSNLIGMWVLPLQFSEWQSAESLGIDGTEEFDILWISEVWPNKKLKLNVKKDGKERIYTLESRIDSDEEKEMYGEGWIFPSFIKENF